MSYRSLILLTFLFLSVRGNGPCTGRHDVHVNDYSACPFYFYCLNGVAHHLVCPDDRWFYDNPAPACYRPLQVPCEPCPSSGITNVRDVESCTSYTLCINGAPARRQCAPGTAFDASLGRCAPQETVECLAPRCPQTGLMLQPDPRSCQHYLLCDHGQEIRRSCMPGLFFDPERRTCGSHHDVTCPISFNVPEAPIYD